MREAVIVSTARTGLAKSHRGGFNNTGGVAMAGHAIDLDCNVRYGLFAEPCSPDDVVEGAVAEDFMAVRPRHVEDRRAVDSYAEVSELGGDKPGVQTRRLLGQFPVVPVEGAKSRRRWRRPPAGRVQALYPAPFLGDEHAGPNAADGFFQVRHQSPYL